MRTNSNTAETLEDSKARVASATDKVKDGVSEIVGETRTMAHMGKEAASKRIDSGIKAVQDSSKEYAGKLEERIIERPLQSLAIAVGVGVLLGRLFKRSS